MQNQGYTQLTVVHHRGMSVNNKWILYLDQDTDHTDTSTRQNLLNYDFKNEHPIVN